MSRENTLFPLGAVILISPYLGLPYAWLMFILPVLGILVIAVGLGLRMRRQKMRSAPPAAAPSDDAPLI